MNEKIKSLDSFFDRDVCGSIVEKDEKRKRTDDQHKLRPARPHILHDKIVNTFDKEFYGIPESELFIGNYLIPGFFHLFVSKDNNY